MYNSISATTTGKAGDGNSGKSGGDDDSQGTSNKSGSFFATFIMMIVIASLGMAIYMITTKLRLPNRPLTLTTHSSTLEEGYEMRGRETMTTTPTTTTNFLQEHQSNSPSNRSSYMPPTMFNTPGRRGGNTATGRYTPLSNDEL